MNVDVSVVITVKNDPRVIGCVDSILSQATTFRFDVLVVDNGSGDDTQARLRERFGDSTAVRLLASPGNLSQAWNSGARSTDAPILVRVDADAVPLPGWLEALVLPLREGRADWSAGPVAGVAPETSLVARYVHHRTEAYSRRLAADPDLRDAVPSWNVAYTRRALEAAGWYDPWQASSVDWDLHKRLAQAGMRGTFATNARALHHHPTTVREFVRKEAWYRTGHYQMVLKYGLREMAGALLLPGAYGLVLALLIAGLAWPVVWWATAVLFLALIARHWMEGYREGDPLWPHRALFRPLEGLAGLYGFARGVVRYGFRASRVE